MSSFVTSDYTVNAIVQGMKEYRYVNKTGDDPEYMAEALRIINEHMTAARYNEEPAHTPVNMKATRVFTDPEIWVSCRCWLYQCDTGNHMELDEITIKAAVNTLSDAIRAKHLADGTWKTETLLGQTIYYAVDECGDWIDIYNLAMWDLPE